ncbi:MAG: amino acid ABC transporter substrate-binding protein [Hyphomicrobiales bacterium]
MIARSARLSFILQHSLIVLVLLVMGSTMPMEKSSAVTSDPIQIGLSLCLTGRHEQPALMQKRAYELWRDEVNGKGGILGRRIELNIIDDRCDLERARRAYRGFVAAGLIDHVIGPYSSEITAAIAPIIDAGGFPMLAAGASSDEIWQKGYGGIFGMWTPASRYTQGMLRLASEAGLSSVAILHADDTFSEGVASGVRKWAPFLKLKIELDVRLAQDPTGLEDDIRRAKDARIDLIIVAGHLNEALRSRQAIAQVGWAPRAFYATVGPALPEWPVLVGDSDDRTFSTSIWEPNDSFPHSRDFAAAFKERFGVDPSYHAATAYAAGEILQGAILAAGSVEREKVRQALYSLDTYTVLGRFAVDRKGMQVKRLEMIIQWQNGRKAVVWPEEIRTAAPVFGSGLP